MIENDRASKVAKFSTFMWITNLAAGLIFCCGIAQAQPQPQLQSQDESTFEPAVALLEIARLPTLKKRQSAIKALIKRREISLDQWLEIMQQLNPAMGVEAGTQTHRPWLELDGRLRETDLVVYVPSSYQGSTPTPLLLLLHGSGGNGASMVAQWRGFAEQNGYLLCAPTDPESGAGYAFTQKERDSGMEALRWMRTHFYLDSNRVHLHGVSRGGHMAWDLAARFPDYFATLVPAIGGPTWVVNEGRNNMRLVENLWATPIRDLQGSQDDARLLKNLHLSFERIHAAGNEDAELIEFPELGHSYRTDKVDWIEFFTTRSRTPFPATLRFRTARKKNSRMSWMQVQQLSKGMAETFPIEVDSKKWARWSHQ